MMMRRTLLAALLIAAGLFAMPTGSAEAAPEGSGTESEADGSTQATTDPQTSGEPDGQDATSPQGPVALCIVEEHVCVEDGCLVLNGSPLACLPPPYVPCDWDDAGFGNGFLPVGFSLQDTAVGVDTNLQHSPGEYHVHGYALNGDCFHD